jgi:hypothetical protein
MPFIAGLLGSNNPSGPKIYPSMLHELGYSAGRFIAFRKSPPKTPLYDRPWFYCMKRDLIIKALPAPLHSYEF